MASNQSAPPDRSAAGCSLELHQDRAWRCIPSLGKSLPLLVCSYHFCCNVPAAANPDKPPEPNSSWLLVSVSQSFWTVEILSLLLYSGGGAGVHEWSFYKQSTDLGSRLRSHLYKMLNNKRLVNWSQSSSSTHGNSSRAQEHLVVIVFAVKPGG